MFTVVTSACACETWTESFVLGSRGTRRTAQSPAIENTVRCSRRTLLQEAIKCITTRDSEGNGRLGSGWCKLEVGSVFGDDAADSGL
jgi:hypothetical protein